MTNIMENLIHEAAAKMRATKDGYGFARTVHEGKTISVRLLEVNTNGRELIQKTWEVDGKRIAAAKVLAM